MLCFHLYTHACFHLISNVHIIRTFENRITFQTLREGHNISYCYISYIKSETSHIWRTGAWLPFGERVEENHLYHLVKPNSILKLRSVYRGCSVYYQIFLDNGKIDFKSKIWNSNINFQTYINFLTKPPLKHRTRVILTKSNLILKRQIGLC